MFRRHIDAGIVTNAAKPFGNPRRYRPMVSAPQQLVSAPQQRASEYRVTAAKLRDVARQANDIAVKAELCWLAQSYERLALQLEQGQGPLAIMDGDRCLEITEFPAKSR
jgi:hypothetical protein